MNAPCIGIISFPGTNNEVESVRAVRRAGMEPVCLKWNDDHERYRDLEGYFLVGGFSYEDRGRSGMIAARDPILSVLAEEASKGKVLLGHCNGAQILVESGLIPMGNGLKMSLAHNAIRENDRWISPGFLNEWVWIKPSCASDRCAAADWQGEMHVPIAHGEGRFVTTDPDVMQELERNDQIAFLYCDEHGNTSEDSAVVPNGSTRGIAGICNPQGNVIALMPHPERTILGDPYFSSVCRWIKAHAHAGTPQDRQEDAPGIRERKSPEDHTAKPVEVFIETIITNNEERTVEYVARRMVPDISLKQFRYIGMDDEDSLKAVLSSLALFNPNKERAFVRMQGNNWYRWDAQGKSLEQCNSPLHGISLLRKDIPDSTGESIGNGAETGICYACTLSSEDALFSRNILEIFANPHASVLRRIS